MAHQSAASGRRTAAPARRPRPLTNENWHENYDINKDCRFVVFVTSDGETVVWSTETKQEIFREQIAEQYRYLAYDEQADRFLIADATDGTSTLKALVRKD